MSNHSRYFRLDEEVLSENWYLGTPVDSQGRELENMREFTSGQRVQSYRRMTVPIDETGRRREFNMAGAGRTVVVNVRVATLFAELAPDDVQLLPVAVQGSPDEYQILVATKLIRCIDDAATEEVLYWKPEDERPDKLGEYRSVYGMRIDPTKVGRAKVFRTWGWDIALIVSDDIKRALEDAHVTGTRFEEV
ncbi:hypothetical protein LZ198_17105 [Myxococcus sp. K15C18031901]|uniref:imm11 family protein n=1 Tax=Myxococcus dinghuensis TaxID=2906761 RepID=UPI0020A70465|nr:DUF1629 domain-containing protein [Myxococcus dinghuensis]MCP3100591.1 hypothetical protein [Myxococcus dinghuensis]